MTRSQKSDIACLVFDLANRVIKSQGFEIAEFCDGSIGVCRVDAEDDSPTMCGAILAGRVATGKMVAQAMSYAIDFCVPPKEQESAREVLRDLEAVCK